MTLLLDTHIWIWSLMDPDRLGRRVREALAAASAELWLSPVSAWELGRLAERGRIELDTADHHAWIEAALVSAPLREAPLTLRVVRALGAIRTPHEDPADRFLAATAAALDLTLVTADRRLLSGSGYRVMANR